MKPCWNSRLTARLGRGGGVRFQRASRPASSGPRRRRRKAAECGVRWGGHGVGVPELCGFATRHLSAASTAGFLLLRHGGRQHCFPLLSGSRAQGQPMPALGGGRLFSGGPGTRRGSLPPERPTGAGDAAGAVLHGVEFCQVFERVLVHGADSVGKDAGGQGLIATELDSASLRKDAGPN